MKIGDIEIKGNVALAPMAGAADRAFREICMNFGAGFCVSELLSAKALVLGDKKSLKMAQDSVNEKQRRCGIQLFGCEPDIMGQAAQIVQDFNPDFIDINMGCPAPKIISSGGGSALLKEPRLAFEIVKAVKDAIKVPLSVKMRAGFSEVIDVASFAKGLEAAGAEFIAVHGRTRRQMYAPGINFEAIKDVKAAVKIPVIANGDITCAKSAKQMLNVTGCDYLMIGRAALGNPIIFREINAFFEDKQISQISLDEKLKILRHQAEKTIEYKGEKVAMLEMRKHAAWYIKGIFRAANLRVKCANLKTLQDLDELIAEVGKTEPYYS